MRKTEAIITRLYESKNLSNIPVFLKELERTFLKHFPRSGVRVEDKKMVGRAIYITFTLGKDKNDFSHGIAENDPMIHNFRIDLDKNVENDEIVGKLVLDRFRGFGIRVKAPPEKNLVYETIKVPFRKTTGDPNKIIKAFDNYLLKLKKEVVNNADKINVPFDIKDKLRTRGSINL